MPDYLSAKKLGVLPEERRALIAFCTAPALGRTIAVNGHAHYYDQSSPSDKDTARANECGTAGCVAGFVFAHATQVQKRDSLRGAKSANAYINKAWRERGGHYDDMGDWIDGVIDNKLLHDIYSEGNDRTLAETRKVVQRALLTGEVKWCNQGQ